MKPCKDQSAEEVTRKARELGVIRNDQSYTCDKGLRDGACTAMPRTAKMLCAKTCNLCDGPKPWTWCDIAGKFCLASQNWCDGNTRCGNPIKNIDDCHNAAMELGLNSTVIELDNKVAPHGCFMAIEGTYQSQLYFNFNGNFMSDSSFVKTLCWVRTTGAFSSFPLIQ